MVCLGMVRPVCGKRFSTGIVRMLTNQFGLLRCDEVLFAAVQLNYAGPSNITELSPALFEKVVKNSSVSRNKGPPTSWMIFYYADWSDSCMEIEPMLADMSLRFVRGIIVASVQKV